MPDDHERIKLLEEQVALLRSQLRELQERVGFARIRFDSEPQVATELDWELDFEIGMVTEALDFLIETVRPLTESGYTPNQDKETYRKLLEVVTSFSQQFEIVVDGLSSLDDTAENNSKVEIKRLLMGTDFSYRQNSLCRFSSYFIGKLKELDGGQDHSRINRELIKRLGRKIDEKNLTSVLWLIRNGGNTFALDKLSRKNLLVVIDATLRMIESAIKELEDI